MLVARLRDRAELQEGARKIVGPAMHGQPLVKDLGDELTDEDVAGPMIRLADPEDFLIVELVLRPALAAHGDGEGRVKNVGARRRDILFAGLLDDGDQRIHIRKFADLETPVEQVVASSDEFRQIDNDEPVRGGIDVERCGGGQRPRSRFEE